VRGKPIICSFAIIRIWIDNPIFNAL